VNKRLLIFVFLLIGFTGKAQLVKRPVIIEPKVEAGFILPFCEALEYVIQDEIYGFDLSLSFPTYGKDYWEKLYNHPRTGIGYSFWSLGNDQILGKAHSLYGYVNFPVFKPTGKFSFNYQVSLGGAYLTKRFNLYENHLNRAIGTHLNLYVRLGIDGKIKLLPRCELLIEAGVTHFSNGKIKSPNYGINVSSFSLGLNYLLNNKEIALQEPEIPRIEKWYVQSVIYSAGSKVYDNLIGKRYFLSSLSYNLERLIDHKKKFGLGADFFYDGAISEALASEDGTPEKDFSKLIRFGLHASYAVRYKQLIMGIQFGHYLYSKYDDLSPFYNRLSVQYLLTKKILWNIAIKSHWGKADCMECGIGYTW
jgi:hypothetical protein